MPEDKESEVKRDGVDFSKRAFIKTALKSKMLLSMFAP